MEEKKYTWTFPHVKGTMSTANIMRMVLLVSSGFHLARIELLWDRARAELPETAGGYIREPKKFVCGGPMRGVALRDLNVSVIKTSAGLLCMSKDYLFKPTACIRCGACMEVCPIRLLPVRLAELAAADKEEEFRRLHGMECLGCGSCSYVCPARRALAPSIQSMRKRLLAQGKR